MTRHLLTRIKASFRRPPDDFQKAAAQLERRAVALRKRPDARAAGNDEVLMALGVFVRVLGKANRTAGLLAATAAILTGLGALVVVMQMQDAHRIAETQNNLALDQEFFGNPKNTEIVDALAAGSPVLVENHGSIKDVELDNYLGAFDDVLQTYSENQLSEHQLCSSFEYYVRTTRANREVEQYIVEARRVDGSQTFIGLDDLAGIVSRSKDPACH